MRLTPSPVLGDIDGDQVPDVALLGSDRVAEVVVQVDRSPTKVRMGGASLAVDVGLAPGDVMSSPITVVKVGKALQWRSTGFLSGVTRIFQTTIGKGSPVVGCYRSNIYTPSMLLQAGTTKILQFFTGPSNITVKVPLGTVSARCGMPVKGTSAVLFLVNNARRQTMNVVAKAGDARIFSSRRLPKTINLKTKGIQLGIVPRDPGQHSTAMLLANAGKTRVLLVRDASNKWQTISLPDIPVGSKPTGITGMRYGQNSYIVVQITNSARESSYKSILVPPEFL